MHRDPTHIPAASFDLSDWTHLSVSGSEAANFLHNFCTADVKALRPGDIREAFIPDIKGRILGHGLILSTDADEFRLIAVPRASQTLLPHFQKYLLGADANFEDVEPSQGLLCCVGDNVPDILATAFGSSAPLENDKGKWVETDAGRLFLASAPLTLLPTVLLLGSRDAVASFRESLPAEMMAFGIPELFELLRIEAGFPWHGRDISDANLAQEAGRTKQAINFQKGCYLGQEPIARLDAMGHTNRELRGLLFPNVPAQAGDAVLHQGQQIGTITSAMQAPEQERTVALAMLKTKHAEPGTELVVQTANGESPALVYWPDLGSVATS